MSNSFESRQRKQRHTSNQEIGKIFAGKVGHIFKLLSKLLLAEVGG
jgi:hypothetical protein